VPGTVLLLGRTLLVGIGRPQEVVGGRGVRIADVNLFTDAESEIVVTWAQSRGMIEAHAAHVPAELHCVVFPWTTVRRRPGTSFDTR